MMKLTLEIEDDLLREIEILAEQENSKVDEVVARFLRSGLKASDRESIQPQNPYRQRTYHMGEPKIDLTKALALVGELEDEAIIEKMKRQVSESTNSEMRD